MHCGVKKIMPTVAVYVHEIFTVGRQSFTKIKTEKLRHVLVLGQRRRKWM